MGSGGAGGSELPQEKKRPYIKKPLNAYMLFMKEMRQKVIEECTLKESAAINQILGRKVSHTWIGTGTARCGQIKIMHRYIMLDNITLHDTA